MKYFKNFIFVLGCVTFAALVLALLVWLYLTWYCWGGCRLFG